MDRRFRILAAALVALAASSACQDYNFNPVGHCLIQPGTRRVTLSDVSTADVLFVVDDSGSMGDEQAAIQSQFGSFMNVLIAANQARVADPALEAIDFHLAVTTTASYYNEPPAYGAVCSNACPGGGSARICCLTDAADALKSPQPPRCQADADCDTANGYACRSDCIGGADVYYKACCKPVVPRTAQPIACTTLGAACGNFDPFYYKDSACSMSYVDDAVPVTLSGPTNYRFPAGKFMSPASNAKVLHFEKAFNWAAGLADPTIQGLAADFGENVVVGTCGSPQEQGIEAARRAIQQVQAGTQPIGAGEFLHPGAKLVVVWVTDEDDCSAPYSAADGTLFYLTGTEGRQCMRDLDGDGFYTDPDPREYDLAAYVDYFFSLGRPLGFAFIAQANTGCTDQSCYPQICCSGPGCSGQEQLPTRYLALASQLRARGADVVVGSICDGFGTTLGRIAEIVKPPTGLTLPTQPAAAEVTILRIARSDGTTRKTCYGPAPAALDAAAAEAAGYDWWFTATADQVDAGQKDPTAASRFVYINHATSNCEANPGETYSADYLGRLPEGGCTDALSCAQVLGGEESDWTCEGYLAGPPVQMGTCLCN